MHNNFLILLLSYIVHLKYKGQLIDIQVHLDKPFLKYNKGCAFVGIITSNNNNNNNLECL